MNRKLHNTTSALLASAGLLVLALIAGSPAPAPSAAQPFAGTTRGAPALADLEAAAQRLEARATTAREAGQAVAGLAALATEAATLAVLAEALGEADATAASSRGAEAAAPRKPRRSHQSVAMPFFSFAPRG